MSSITLELSKADVDLITKALDAYEQSPNDIACIATMADSMVRCLTGGPQRTEEQVRQDVSKTRAEADVEVKKRKLESLRLRLALHEASQRPSEFSR